MQEAHSVLKYELWNKLKVIFNKYAKDQEQIPTSEVKTIVETVLGQTSPQQIDYVIKNMFRLDSDGSGTVDFLQFGNFLFKRHCGQMSLQKMHRANLIARGAEHLINLKEFQTLVNNAYQFLNVTMDANNSQAVFKQADKDGDGHITYVEYFKFIEKCVCQTKTEYIEYSKSPSPQKIKEVEPKVQAVDLGRQWNSRLRLYIWHQLRKLYEAFILGKNLTLNDKVIRGLITSILGQLSESEYLFILNGILRLDKGVLQFLPFAVIFIYLVAELFLTRFQKNHSTNKKFLNFQEFLTLFRNTFKFLTIGRVRRQILFLIFGKIDTNNDGLISISEYLNWVRRFLAVDINRGDEYYVKEDDEAIQGGDIFEQNTSLDVLHDVSHKRVLRNSKLVFSNFELSDLVRKRVLELLIPFDVNCDKKFDEGQIRNALINLLKQNQYELAYVTRNVFRYDVDGDKNVTYEQLTNFCVEQHFGQMAIQRLHRKNNYSRGAQRIMNQAEFAMTLNNALSFIQLSANEQQISLLFSQLDVQKRGWITYELYFLFLRHYFGSLRGTSQKVENVVDPEQEWYKSLLKLSALDRFIRLLFDQSRRIFERYDYNKNMLFQEDEIEAILQNVFGLNESQSSYVLDQFFNFSTRANKSLTFDQLIRILLEVYFIEIILKRHFRDVQTNQWKTRKISLEQFITMVLSACAFLRIKPTRPDLIQIFKSLDTDNDGYITFAQYIAFIRKYLGIGLEQFNEKQEKPAEIPKQEWDFINAIWSQLKAYFDRYDSGSKGYLNQADLKRFIIEVLHEDTQRQLDYVFWNLFRVDPNQDRKTEFNQFAPFILRHAGEIALQKFHREQVKGKNTLDCEQLYIVFSNAFSFLSTMPKSRPAVQVIYNRIGKGSNPSYANYMSWINVALAKKFEK